MNGLERKMYRNNLLDKTRTIQRQVNQLKSRNVNVESLDAISDDLGDQRSGRFLALVTGSEPTDSDATGTFLSANGENYIDIDSNPVTAHIGGVKDGVLQFGLNADDGSAYCGQGAVKIDENGIKIKADNDLSIADVPLPNVVQWEDTVSRVIASIYGTLSQILRIEARDGKNDPIVKSSEVNIGAYDNSGNAMGNFGAAYLKIGSGFEKGFSYIENLIKIHNVNTIRSNQISRELKSGYVLPFVGSRKFVYVQSAAAVYQTSGAAAVTTSGTLSNSNDTDSSYVNHAIAATAASTGGIVTAFTLTRTGYYPHFYALVRTGSVITNLRIWVGLHSAAPGNSDNPGNNHISFRYSSVAGDTTWRTSIKNGTTQTLGNSGVTVEVSTAYLLELWIGSDGKAYFSVNGNEPIMLDATLPATSQNLGLTVIATTTTDTAKNFKISRAYLEHD